MNTSPAHRARSNLPGRNLPRTMVIHAASAVTFAVAVAATTASAWAAGDGEGPDGSTMPWKATFGHYRMSEGPAGNDLNLRWRQDGRSAWIGLYRDASVGQQWRAGWDDQWALPAQFSLLPSLQVAQGGFVGGSLNLQWGSAWYGQAGIGRTNLKPYVNLNFDPNDALMAAVGHQDDAGWQWQASLITDDRLHTGQKHWHLSARWPVAAGRLGVDLLRKSGQGDAGWVSAWGATATLDVERWFLRLAYDPKQNFSAADAWRLSAGLRF